MSRQRNLCQCTPADNGGRPLPADRIAMVHRAHCPFVRAGWDEYHRRVTLGQTPADALREMDDAQKER